MLLTLLTWHLLLTTALLSTYLLVAGLQWAGARVRGLTARTRAARPAPVVVPAARREAEPGHAVASSAA